MAVKRIEAIFKLRRDYDYNYEKVKDTFIPSKGEVCLVDTNNYGLRSKVGDGITSYGKLAFSDNSNNVVLTGYFFNGSFYVDSTYTVELEKGEKHLYIDKNSKSSLYIWNGEVYIPLAPEATETIAGVMKLYQAYGKNIDGTMSQKAITDGITSIKLELDKNSEECLVLNLPYTKEDI